MKRDHGPPTVDSQQAASSLALEGKFLPKAAVEKWLRKEVPSLPSREAAGIAGVCLLGGPLPPLSHQ